MDQGLRRPLPGGGEGWGYGGDWGEPVHDAQWNINGAPPRAPT